MPLVPYESSILFRRQTLAPQEQPFDVQRQADEAANDKTSFLDLSASALRQNNVISGLPRLAESFDDVYDPNYDPLTQENLAGYEQFSERFINSGSQAESNRIKERIHTEMSDREVIRQAHGAGLATSIAAGVIDPITLASMMIPVAGTGSRLARIGKTVLTSMALDTAQEAILHGEQSLRTLQESAINVGAGALLTGALGTLATRIPKAEFDALKQSTKNTMDATAPFLGEVESTGGAARVGFGTTLEDETIAKGGEAIAKTMGKINPIARVMTSTSKRARILMQEIADVPFMLNKHLKGIATPTSAEGEILAEQAVRYRLINETDAAWAAHKSGGGTIKRGAFGEELAAALRRGDQSATPEIAAVAKSYRKYFDESLKKLKAAGLVAEDTAVQFAQTYLPRLYDHAKIRANRVDLEDALTDWFSRSKEVDTAEVKTAVADVIDTINGSLRDHAQISPGFVGKSGNLKERTLNVPDEVLEPWLVNDIDKVMESYIRSTAPQLAIKKKFGDLDMKQQMQDVRDEYVALRERAKSNEAKDAITKEMESTLRDVQAIRDILLNKFAKPADPDSLLVKTGRAFRAWNYVRLLGGQTLSSLPDAGRIVARHGLVKTAKKIARLVTDSELRNLTKTDAHRVGTALEYVLNTRADTLGDIGNELASSKLDRFMRRESNRFSRLTGMASWNSALKTLAVGLEQDAIVRAVNGGTLSKFQRGQLASLGIGDRMLERIGKQMKHAKTDTTLSGGGESVTHSVDETGEHVVKSANGETLAQESDKFLIAKRSDTTSGARGKGEGTARYVKLQKEAEARGLTLASDVSVSPSQIKVYERLKSMGYDIKRNPAEVNENTGNLVSADPRVPVFEVRSKAAEPTGLKRANTEVWTDREAAKAFEGALLKSADRVVLTKGAGDVPLFMNKDIGKTLFQFKSFGMASVNRQLIPMAQGIAHGDLATINGASVMLALGALANAARDTASGYKPTTDPARITIEAFDRAGFSAYLAEPFDIVSGTFGGPRFGRFTSSSISETAAGPTFGTAEDIRSTLQGMFTDSGKFDPGVKSSDVYRFRKLLPYQNLFYLRRLVNALEGEFSENIGAQGAGSKTLGERATEMKELHR